MWWYIFSQLRQAKFSCLYLTVYILQQNRIIKKIKDFPPVFWAAILFMFRDFLLVLSAPCSPAAAVMRKNNNKSPPPLFFCFPPSVTPPLKRRKTQTDRDRRETRLAWCHKNGGRKRRKRSNSWLLSTEAGRQAATTIFLEQNTPPPPLSQLVYGGPSHKTMLFGLIKQVATEGIFFATCVAFREGCILLEFPFFFAGGGWWTALDARGYDY